MRRIFTSFFKTLFTTLFLKTYTWQNVATGGGGFVTGIITSKTKKDLIYAMTDVGGVYPPGQRQLQA